MKPKVQAQGKAIVERGTTRLLVMLPDGDVIGAKDERDALARIRKWFKVTADIDAINVGQIEWRHGLIPPKED